VGPTEFDRAAASAEITKAIVALHREYYGRGATRARTFINDSVVFCLMEDIFMPAERTLIEAGKYATVQQTRSDFQDAMQGRFVEIVEQHVRRQVAAFLSQTSSDGYGIEFFVLR